MKPGRRAVVYGGGALLVALSAGARAADPGLVRLVRDAEVDWGAGLVVAEGGAAADIRMPSPDVARPGAERRARAAAVAKLRVALPEMPLGRGRNLAPKAIEAALAQVKTVRVDYQSNGGAIVRLGVAFADLVGAPDPEEHDEEKEEAAAGPTDEPLVLTVASMPFEVSPALLVGDHRVRIPWAVYRLGPPPAGAGALGARRDKSGRLTVEEAVGKSRLRTRPSRAVIYLERPTR